MKVWGIDLTIILYFSGILLIISLVLVFINSSLISGGSPERLSPIISRIRFEAISLESFLSEAKHGYSLRNAARSIFYLFFVIVILLKPIYTDIFSSNGLKGISPSILAFIGLLLLIELISILAIIFIMRYPGFGLRLVPGLSGMLSTLSILILFCTQAPWVASEGHIKADYIAILRTKQTIINKTNNIKHPAYTNSTDTARREIENTLEKASFQVLASWMGVILLIAFAVFMFMLALKGTLKGYQYQYQMAKRPDCEWSQRAIQGRNFIVKFRFVFIGVLVLIGSCIILAITRLAITTYYLLCPQCIQTAQTNLNAVETSVFFTSLALNVPLDSMLPCCLVYIFWSFYLLICWLIVGFSIGSFFVQPLLFSLRFRTKNDDDIDCITRLSEKITAIWRRHSTAPAPAFILTHSELPIARARRAGLFTHRTAVELSTGSLNILTDDELEAVVAHELGHCIARHCLIDDLARFAGRCTFVGDGFAECCKTHLVTKSERTVSP